MEIEIRLLSGQDEELLLSLFDAVLPGFVESPVDAAGPALFVGDPASFAFGAYVDGVPAGLAWGMQMTRMVVSLPTCTSLTSSRSSVDDTSQRR